MALATLVAEGVTTVAFGSGTDAQRLAMWPVWGATSAIGNFVFARWLGVLKNTQGHTFLFVPVRYWTFMFPVFGLVGLVEALLVSWNRS